MPCKGWLLSLVPSRSNASFRPLAVIGNSAKQTLLDLGN